MSEQRIGFALSRAGRGTPPPRVVIAGSITRDRIERAGEVSWCLGGVVWHAGAMLSKLGIDTRVVTRCAERDAALVGELTERGVEVVWSTSRATTVFVNSYPGAGAPGRDQRVEALADPIASGTVLEAAADASLLYLGPLHPGDLASGLLDALRERDELRVALDIQGYTRIIAGGRVAPGLDPRLPELIARCAFVKASVPEARLVAGSGDPAQLAGALAGTRREALVTAGDAGAWLFADGYGCFERQAETLPVDPIDPTGGGDILFAHYLAARLLGGAPEAALRRAVAGRAERLLDPDRHRHLDPR